MKKPIHPFLIALTAIALSSCATATKTESTASAPTTQDQYVNNAVGNDQTASWYTEVKFEKGSATLDDDDRAALDDLVKKSMNAGKVDEIKIISWADQEYPSEARKKLSESQRKLADHRNTRIKDYLKEAYPSLDVKSYNMAERPNAIENFLKTSDSKTKKSMEQAGISVEGNRAVHVKKGSTALILSILE